MNLNFTEIQKLSSLERVQIMELLWDTMKINNEVNSPDWHKSILKERNSRIDTEDYCFIKLSDLKSAILS